MYTTQRVKRYLNKIRDKSISKKEVLSISLPIVVTLSGMFLGGGIYLGKLSAKYDHIEQLQKDQEKSLELKLATTEITAEEHVFIPTNERERIINTKLQKFIKTNQDDKEKKLDEANSACSNIINYKEPYFFKKIESKKRNSKEMVTLCMNATLLDKSNSKNLFYLAVAYHQNRDYMRTIEYLEKSSDLNNRIAQRKLGIMFRTGNLVQKDTEKYSKYFGIASNNGDKASKIIILNEYYH